MYVCMCACVYLCECMHVHIYLCINVCMYVYICVCMYVYQTWAVDLAAGHILGHIMGLFWHIVGLFWHIVGLLYKRQTWAVERAAGAFSGATGAKRLAAPCQRGVSDVKRELFQKRPISKETYFKRDLFHKWLTHLHFTRDLYTSMSEEACQTSYTDVRMYRCKDV